MFRDACTDKQDKNSMRPVTLRLAEAQKIYRWMSYLSVWKLAAAVQASSSVSTRSGTRRHPGPFSVRSSWCSVLSTWAARQASILDTTTNVGTPRASAKPRCSLLVPTVDTRCTRDLVVFKPYVTLSEICLLLLLLLRALQTPSTNCRSDKVGRVSVK